MEVFLEISLLRVLVFRKLYRALVLDSLVVIAALLNVYKKDLLLFSLSLRLANKEFNIRVALDWLATAPGCGPFSAY